MELLAKKEQTCCFTGHRPSKLPWRSNENHPECLALKRKIEEILEDLYRRGYRHFMTGMAKGCDLYFAEAVLNLRERYPDVTLEAAIPCKTQTNSWTYRERQRYMDLLEQCNIETLIQREYSRDCMLRRNRYMVERSSLLIAAYNGQGGGTKYTIQHAEKCGLEIILLPIEAM